MTSSRSHILTAAFVNILSVIIQMLSVYVAAALKTKNIRGVIKLFSALRII
jgi:hypothetical protein